MMRAPSRQAAALVPAAAPALREAPRARLDEVLFAHGAHISRRAWAAHSASPPPIFFMTCARAWLGSLPEAAEARNTQYAANIGGVLALGYDVVLAVSPTEGPWPLLSDLAAAAAPGQLRVHLCAPSADYQGRSGPDETRCMQEALHAVWGACVDGDGIKAKIFGQKRYLNCRFFIIPPQAHLKTEGLMRCLPNETEYFLNLIQILHKGGPA
jgi:hypothetical protein